MIAAVLAFVLKHETLVGWAAVLLGAAVMGATLAAHVEAPRLARARAETQAARQEAQASAAAARLNADAAEVVEVARTREAAVTRTAQETADALDHAPDAGAPVPEDVLRSWASGVDRLRDEAASARAPAADPGGAGAARPLPAA
jgi:hypothetical protein